MFVQTFSVINRTGPGKQNFFVPLNLELRILKKKDISLISFPLFPNMQKIIALFKTSQTSPTCPSSQNSIVHWRNDTDGVKPKYWEQTLSQYYAHHQYYMDWPVTEPGPPQCWRLELICTLRTKILCLPHNEHNVISIGNNQPVNAV
jgi:hypothetical protein